MTDSVGFIGLGNMGAPMAENLLDAGFPLGVYNRSTGKAEPLSARGAKVEKTPREAAANADVVITMLADDAALDAVTHGDDGLLAGLDKGKVHVSMSTVSPATAERLSAEHERHGATYVAAPVFGRPDAAKAKKLWICAAGNAAARQRVKPVFDALGQGVFEFGDEPSKANIVKLAGNFMLVSAIEAMSEAFALAEKSGIDRQQVAELFYSTLFNCPVYQGYGRAIASERYEPPGFRLKLGRKDVNLVIEAALARDVPMPLASLLRDRLTAAVARGRGDLDWAALGLSASEEAGLGK
jgi:3-hydroxyisobutyrate dehydrogenase-like beta-hydroxyacid dehydrogenase